MTSVQLPKEGKLSKDSKLKLINDCVRESHRLHHLLSLTEVLIPKDSETKLIDIREKFFKKTLLITAGNLKTLAKAIEYDKL